MAPPRGRLAPVKISPSSPLAGLRFELGRIQAAMYLIDQVEIGDLSFLAGQTPSFTCWSSFVSLSAEDLADNLRRMAYREVAGALKDTDTALRAAAAPPARAGQEPA